MALTGEDLIALVTEAKKWLRISASSEDDEIGQTINACLADLSNAGVIKIDTSDALIRQAIKLYLKSQYGYDADAEKFSKSYEFLKSSLSLSGDYGNGQS